jgi:putative FmdB family regulatory protein
MAVRVYVEEALRMPILEYVCEDCAHQFETIVLGSREPACPACASKHLERRLSVFAVGGQSADFAAREPFGPCGTCGDPRGPGACSMN